MVTRTNRNRYTNYPEIKAAADRLGLSTSELAEKTKEIISKRKWNLLLAEDTGTENRSEPEVIREICRVLGLEYSKIALNAKWNAVKTDDDSGSRYHTQRIRVPINCTFSIHELPGYTAPGTPVEKLIVLQPGQCMKFCREVPGGRYSYDPLDSYENHLWTMSPLKFPRCGFTNPIAEQIEAACADLDRRMLMAVRHVVTSYGHGELRVIAERESAREIIDAFGKFIGDREVKEPKFLGKFIDHVEKVKQYLREKRIPMSIKIPSPDEEPESVERSFWKRAGPLFSDRVRKKQLESERLNLKSNFRHLIGSFVSLSGITRDPANGEIRSAGQNHPLPKGRKGALLAVVTEGLRDASGTRYNIRSTQEFFDIDHLIENTSTDILLSVFFRVNDDRPGDNYSENMAIEVDILSPKD